jgi:hypothetical protein
MFGLLVSCFGVAAARASESTIDFQAVGGNDNCLYLVGQTISTQGFQFTEPRQGLSLFTCNGAADPGSYWPVNGSRSLAAQDVIMQTIDGSPFDLSRFDLSQAYVGIDSSFDVYLSVFGTRGDGSNALAHFSTAGTDGFRTITLGPEFSDLVSVEFVDTHQLDLPNVFLLDNMVVGTVPEPTTALLLALGLGSLTVPRRRSDRS